MTDVGSGRGVSPGPRAGPALLPSTFPAGHLQVTGFVATPACDRDCASSTTRGRLPAEEKPPRPPEDSRPSAVGVWLIGSCAAVRNPASEAVGAARKGGEKLQPQLSGCSGGRRRGFNEDGTGGGSPPDTAFSRAFPCPTGDGPGDDPFPVTSLLDPRQGRADACRVGNMPVSWMVTEAPSLGAVHEPGERSFSDLRAGLSSTERWAEGVGASHEFLGGSRLLRSQTHAEQS